MFGRRRRTPLLTAAVIAGTAGAASRHGARKQAEMEYQMGQEAELRRLQNQRDIDQAVNDAMAKQQQQQQQQQGSQAQSGSSAQGMAPGSYPVQYRDPPVVMQPGSGPPPNYSTTDNYVTSSYLQPAAADAIPRPRSAAAADSDICFCAGCGNKCGMKDNFCGKCGRSLSKGN